MTVSYYISNVLYYMGAYDLHPTTKKLSLNPLPAKYCNKLC
jgi:hypothetical protein